MKKSFKYFAIVWAVVFVLFNLIWFLVPGDVSGVYKDEANFWIGYAFVAISIIGHLACAYFTFKRGLDNTFYNISTVKASYSGLVLTFIVATLVMLISAFPIWLCILLCVIVLLLNVIAVLKAVAPAEMVGSIDKKIKTQTLFIKSLTVDAQGLVNRAENEEVKKVCTDVYEAVRYSDPMSNDALAGVEAQITIKFAAFSEAVSGGSEADVKSASKELLALIADRNNKCKLLK